jgi:hypothetical protein
VGRIYDNVLIDVLCGVILEKDLPLEIVRFMRSLLWCKTLVFCVGGAECMSLTECKGPSVFGGIFRCWT